MKIESLNSLVDLLLTVGDFDIPRSDPMYERGVIRIESVKVERPLIQYCVVLPYELQTNEVNI
jgi:hypothetical protein